MKKVVLLAGVVAAGMAAAPVAANAAAPEINDIQEINAGTPKTDLTSLHGVIDERSKELYQLEKAVNEKSGAFAGISDAAKAAVLKDLTAMKEQLGLYFTALDTEYDALSAAQQNGTDTPSTAWTNLVAEIDNYLYKVVSPATFDALEATYSHFAQDLDKWIAYDQEIKGVTSGGGYATWKLDDKYQGVNEMEDVIAATTNFETTTKNAATTALGPKPDLGAVDGVPTFDATASHPVDNPTPIETAIQNYKDAKKDLQDLVADYMSDKAGFTNTYNQKTPTGYDEKKNQDNVFSAGWKATVDAAAAAAKDYIETFDATDAAQWRADHTTEGDGINDNAGYEAGAQAALDALKTAIDNEAANVTAYDQLMTVLNQASADVAVLRTTYWNKRKEGHAGSLAFPENDRYVYRALIIALENTIANNKSEVASKFQNGDPATDCVGLLGGKTAAEFYAELLSNIETSAELWAANEAANDAADVYFGRQDHHEASTADEAYYESFNLGSLRNDAKDAIAHIDDHAAGQPFEVVEVWDPATETYVAKQINAADYNANFTCEHSEAVHGFTQLYTDLQAARQAQFDAYNSIGAVAWNLLNVKDAAGEETGFVAEYKDHLNLVISQASTDQAQLYTERAQAELDKTKKAMEELDGVCEEVRTCDPADCGEAQANPCGWHHAATAAALEAIEGTDGSMNAANAAIDADHDAEEADDDTIAAAKAAGTAIEAEVAAWKALFEAADAAHKAKLDQTYAETTAAIHKAIHEVVGQAEFDLHNFDNGDKAAADKWAQALENVDLDLDGAADTFADFEDFVAKLEAAEAIYQDKADELYNNHFWTQLEALHQQVLAFQDVDTYMVPVNANRTARLEAIAKLEAKGADFKVFLDELEAAAGTYYAADVDTDVIALQTLLGNEMTAIETSYENASFEADADAHADAFAAIDEALNEARVSLANAVKRYAANVVAAGELTNLFQDLVDIVKTAPVGDVYESDATNLETKRAEVLGHIQVEIGYIAADLLIGKVVENRAQTMEAYQAMLDEVNGFQGQIKDAEKYLADSKAKAAKLTSDVDDLIVLLRSALPGDVYENIESDKDLEALYAIYETLSDDLVAENTAIATDLTNRAILDNAAAHEAAISALSIRVAEFQGKVKEYEQFKADNQAARDALVNDLTNLLVTVDGLKKYGDVYDEGVEGGLDAYSIDRAIENLENAINGDLNFLQNIDYPAGEVLDNVLQYKAGIETYKQDIEDIKAQIAAAEQLYAANLRALNNLEEHIKSVETVLHTTKAMCACNECNVEDQAEVDALLGQLDTILGEVNDAFADTKDLWQKEGQFKNDVEAVEADAANLLALIQLHLDRVQNDLRVYNTLQTLLVSVDAEMLKLEAEEGYQHFANRDAYHADDYNPERPHFHDGATTNPYVKYGNELAQMVEDLKAEIERQHSHEGGHSCEENKIADVKAMNDIKAEIEKTIAAIKANEAAHELLKDRFNELFEDAKDAYNFWHQYYSTATLITHEGDIANWIQEWNGELENGYVLAALENTLHDDYVHGNAANLWTVDGKGEELNGDANDKFAKYDEDLANDRNEFAHTEALNHLAQVVEFLDTYKNGIYATYTEDGLDDPFVKDILVDWREAVEGEYGLYASLNIFREDIQAAYEEGVMEDAINIDNHNTALGIHQQLDGVLGVLSQIEAEYADLFEAAHHLTNGKTVYSDQEYFTLGFFREANDGLGFQGQEMFTKVVVNDMDKINVLDLTAYESEDVYEDPTDFNSPYTTTYATDEDGNLIRWNDGYATDVQVLVNGNKQNELTFNIPQPMAPLAVTTLLAGPADIEFLPGSITVVADEYGNEWTTKHNVYIGFNVAEPVVEENQDVDAAASSSKLIVRVANPVDLTYTSKVLVATTNTGDQFSFADATFNTAKGQIEFELPEGTESVVLPEGFFTFRTGENTIARSAACTVVVAGATSIEGLIAMGEKAQIFDLQGRRVKAEALISGNTYVVNGEKVMVK